MNTSTNQDMLEYRTSKNIANLRVLWSSFIENRVDLAKPNMI